MPAARLPDSARYWRTPLLPDADLLTATYRNHTFAPHWHDAYTIPVILEGAERYMCRGSGHVAETGTVPVINPGEVHTARARPTKGGAIASATCRLLTCARWPARSSAGRRTRRGSRTA
jgi:hypothetical protein